MNSRDQPLLKYVQAASLRLKRQEQIGSAIQNRAFEDQNVPRSQSRPRNKAKGNIKTERDPILRET
jgi:hypothetical protein